MPLIAADNHKVPGRGTLPAWLIGCKKDDHKRRKDIRKEQRLSGVRTYSVIVVA